MSRIGVGRTIDGGGSKPTVSSTIINKANTAKTGVPASLKPPTQSSSPAPITQAEVNARLAGRATPSPTPSSNTASPAPAPAPAPTVITAAPVAATPTPTSIPPAATPPVPQQNVVATPAPAVKSAPIDTVEFIDETLSDERIIELLFEDVGGQELLTIARNDTVNGQNVIYQPFKNLGILQETYNPTNLLRLQQTSDKFFSNFTISLRDKIPNIGSGENGKNYRLDPVTGEGIIEFINIRSDEQVEVQILSAGIIEDIDLIESTES